MKVEQKCRSILTSVRVWCLARDLYVGLEEPLEGDIGGEALHPIVRNAVFCTALGALHLQYQCCRYHSTKSKILCSIEI